MFAYDGTLDDDPSDLGVFGMCTHQTEYRDTANTEGLRVRRAYERQRSKPSYGSRRYVGRGKRFGFRLGFSLALPPPSLLLV